MKKLICLAALMLAGCEAGSLYRSEEYQGRPLIHASLVKDEKALLSEEAIRTLLESRIRIPERVKLAVLPLGHHGTHDDNRYWRDSHQADFVQHKKAYLEALEGPLAETGRFPEITHVPALMLPPDPSLTRLREVAALMQAGLLLVYSTESHIVTWVSPFLFSRDQVRVLASVDLILLDVRTGVVPYAETFHAEHLEKERSKDLSIVETQRRAERKATLLVLGRAAEGLKRFMAP